MTLPQLKGIPLWRKIEMKTKEELNNRKDENKKLNNKLKELTEDELKFVTGGVYKKDISSDKEFADSENDKTKINFANAA